MLRITPTELNGGSGLKLEGKLSGPWVDEMKGCWSSLDRRPSARIGINLRDVSYVDDRGKDLLLLMEREGASLIGASEFVRNLLEEHRNGQKRSRGRDKSQSQEQQKIKENDDASPIQP